MIIKGSARGQSTADVTRLARHLQSGENERVEVLEFRGLAARTLPDALEEMRLGTLGTRARHALYHASLNLDRDEASNLGRSRWLEAVDELEFCLGMRGHQRVVVEHVKHGRNHVHVVWCRADASTQKVASDGHNYRKHEECARTLEARWQLKKVTGVHSRVAGTRRPVATATHGDWQAQERTGIQVDHVIAALEEAWAATTNGKAFAAAIAREGLSLAIGRRGVIVVDAAGTPHSLPRRLRRTAAEIRRKLADLDEKRLPTVDDLKRDAQKNRRSKNMPQSFGATNGQQARGRAPAERARGQPNHWRNLGFDLVEVDGVLSVTLPSGTVLADHGERLVLTCAQEPTDEDIRIMITAGKARGWESIRFYGGSPEFQRRARVEALRQGYRLDQITLECEEGAPQMPASAAMPMPGHIKRRLVPDTPPVPQPIDPTPAPLPEMRP